MRILLTLDRDASAREENDYVGALVGAGFRRDEILILPPGASAPGAFDGVVIGGGCDVDPARYGQIARADANLELDPERDATDFALLDLALGSQAPTLAICRGLQVVNVAMGGTLVQDLPTQRPGTLAHEVAPKEKETRPASATPSVSRPARSSPASRGRRSCRSTAVTTRPSNARRRP